MLKKYSFNLSNFLLILTIFFLLHHFSLWYLTKNSLHSTYEAILSGWDSGHYSGIVSRGYDTHSIAFYPLYPLLVKILSFLFPKSFSFSVIGTIFSTLLFCIFIFFQYKFSKSNLNLPNWLVPKTWTGYFLLIYAPVSYIFHSNHTEALFLLLSFFAFLHSFQKKWFIASIFAGLCALTKNQGIVLSIAIALFSATHYTSYKEKIRIFILSGGVSFLFFLTFLIYQYIKFGNFFSFIIAQKYWHTKTLTETILHPFLILYHFREQNFFYEYEIIYYIILLISTILLLKKSKIIFFYVISCLALALNDGGFETAFRFSVFLFPLLFTLGDYIASKNKFILFLLVIFFFYLNHQMARNFVLTRWCY